MSDKLPPNDDHIALVARPAERIWFTEVLGTADDPVEVLDRDGCTWITTNGQTIGQYLPCGDLREVRDRDNRNWIVQVERSKVVIGFLLEDTFAHGELVICMAEEEGLGECPGPLCRDPRQICRNRREPWEEPTR